MEGHLNFSIPSSLMTLVLPSQQKTSTVITASCTHPVLCQFVLMSSGTKVIPTGGNSVTALPCPLRSECKTSPQASVFEHLILVVLLF